MSKDEKKELKKMQELADMIQNKTISQATLPSINHLSKQDPNYNPYSLDELHTKDDLLDHSINPNFDNPLSYFEIKKKSENFSGGRYASNKMSPYHGSNKMSMVASENEKISKTIHGIKKNINNLNLADYAEKRSMARSSLL